MLGLFYMKILMLKGLPGSGKSTWAKTFVSQNPGWVRINKDSLREMMSGYRPGKDEALILAWRDALIYNSLSRDKNVVVDDTNFHPKHEARLREIASSSLLFPVEVETKFFDTPLNQCIKNDLKRLNSVGEKVIKNMWREFLAPKSEAPKYDNDLPDAIICDLDGTIAIHTNRGPYDMEKLETDSCNMVVLDLLTDAVEKGWQIIFCSGREAKYRERSQKWLTQWLAPELTEMMFTRLTGDKREDSVIKQEIYDNEIKGKYNVQFILDDRNRVVDMWRRNGLKCFQVAEGDF